MSSLRLRAEEVLVPSAITTGLVVVSVIFPLISAASIYLRFYVRRTRPRKYGWDDTWLIIAWVQQSSPSPRSLPFIPTNKSGTQQVSTFAIAILVWVCSGISGVNYYTVDEKKGQFISSLVRANLDTNPLQVVKKASISNYNSL